MHALATRAGIEIRIGDVPLAFKIDALGAALDAVREAHRDEISPESWAALNRARDCIGDALLHLRSFPADGGPRITGNRSIDQGGTHAPGEKAGFTPNTTPAALVVDAAGDGDTRA